MGKVNSSLSEGRRISGLRCVKATAIMASTFYASPMLTQHDVALPAKRLSDADMPGQNHISAATSSRSRSFSPHQLTSSFLLSLQPFELFVPLIGMGAFRHGYRNTSLLVPHQLAFVFIHQSKTHARARPARSNSRHHVSDSHCRDSCSPPAIPSRTRMTAAAVTASQLTDHGRRHQRIGQRLESPFITPPQPIAANACRFFAFFCGIAYHHQRRLSGELHSRSGHHGINTEQRNNRRRINTLIASISNRQHRTRDHRRNTDSLSRIPRATEVRLSARPSARHHDASRYQRRR